MEIIDCLNCGCVSRCLIYCGVACKNNKNCVNIAETEYINVVINIY